MEDFIISEVKDILRYLAKKIQNYEEKNPDYLHSKKWKDLRKQQDSYYEKLRRLECLKNQQKNSYTPTKQRRCLETDQTNSLSQ